MWRCALSSDNEVRQSLEAVVRVHHAQIIAALTRRFGAEHLDLVEDAVQTALVRALERWRGQDGVSSPNLVDPTGASVEEDSITRQQSECSALYAGVSVVIGNFPFYLVAAQNIGAAVFDWGYSFETFSVATQRLLQWQFLRSIVQNQLIVQLANWPPREGSIFFNEVRYLTKKGYIEKICKFGRFLVPGP